jgi:hypothetical protein
MLPLGYSIANILPFEYLNHTMLLTAKYEAFWGCRSSHKPRNLSLKTVLTTKVIQHQIRSKDNNAIQVRKNWERNWYWYISRYILVLPTRSWGQLWTPPVRTARRPQKLKPGMSWNNLLYHLGSLLNGHISIWRIYVEKCSLNINYMGEVSLQKDLVISALECHQLQINDS